MTNRLLAKGIAAGVAALILLCSNVAWCADTTETIVLLRHGEKPPGGLGQLNCRGLNRALALPGAIAKLFGRPDAIFAPDPAMRKDDAGIPYDYVRPLATIEPTAIALGLPINAGIGFSDVDGLRAALERPSHRNELIVVAWEHKLIPKIARALLAAHGGDENLVPKWPEDDFDTVDIVAITRTGAAETASFRQAREGLDGEPEICPHG
jgi:hypothetical protein